LLNDKATSLKETETVVDEASTDLTGFNTFWQEIAPT